MSKVLHAGGRPTKYRPEYCEAIVNFFDKDPIEKIEVVKADKEGNPYTLTTERPCQCPTFEKFAADCGVSRQTLLSWTKEFPEFLVAYERSRGLQANIMMVNGMSGAFNAAFTNLSMKNMHGWSDKQEIDNIHTINQMPAVKLGGNALEFDIGDAIEIEDKEGNQDG